jgi:TM2 domain-containing membrane protein YozV
VVDQLRDASVIEQRLLELAHTTDAKITAPALAYFAQCSIEDASRVLDDLTARNRLSMEIEDDGTIVYQMFGRQKLAARRPLVPPAALVPMVRRAPHASPLLAGLLTVFVPGAGHLYAGRIGAAILWFLVVSLGYALLFPGLVLHLFSIVSAAAAARRLDGEPPPRLLPPAGGYRASF